MLVCTIPFSLWKKIYICKEQNNMWIIDKKNVSRRKGSSWYQLQNKFSFCCVFSFVCSHEQWWMCLRTCGASLGYFTIRKGRNKQHSLFAFLSSQEKSTTQLNTQNITRSEEVEIKSFVCEGLWVGVFDILRKLPWYHKFELSCWFWSWPCSWPQKCPKVPKTALCFHSGSHLPNELVTKGR